MLQFAIILYFSLILDCSPPFGVSIRTSNEDTKGFTEAQLDTNSAAGTAYILGHEATGYF